MDALVTNKKIGLDYEIIETFEAGLELLGFEVKSLRKHQGSLLGSYIIVRGGEVFLVGALVPPYQEKNTPEGYNPRRNRKLLLTKAEIKKLAALESQKGLTIAPISVYNKGEKVKIEIAIVRGKKKFDKRQDIKKRETERDLRREFKER
jgi:SsrA-binding protein